MPPKKPLFSPLTVTKSASTAPAAKKSLPVTPKLRSQADKQWQRTKRYGWDSR